MISILYVWEGDLIGNVLNYPVFLHSQKYTPSRKGNFFPFLSFPFLSFPFLSFPFLFYLNNERSLAVKSGESGEIIYSKFQTNLQGFKNLEGLIYAQLL